MRKILLLPIFTILLAIWNAYGNPASPNAAVSTTASSTYVSPTPGKFPIVAWCPYNTGRASTRADFDTMISCGFNAAVFGDKTDTIYPVLSRINGLDVSLLIGMEWYLVHGYIERCTPVVQGIKNYMIANDIDTTIIGGYVLCDEPSLDYVNTLRQFQETIKSLDPDVMSYSNLPPEAKFGNSSNVGMMHSYSSSASNREALISYLNRYCDIVCPPMLSYDYYPFMINSAGNLEIDFTDFYYNLSLFAHLSKARAIPFWAHCQSMNVVYLTQGTEGHRPYRPLPTQELLRYEAFNALAMGAQGIMYWAYSCHDTEDPRYYHNSALVDRDGHKTTAWAAAQAVNREIQKYDTVFLGCRLKGYKFIGDQYLRPTEVSTISDTVGNFTASVVSGKGALLSRLSNNGREYVVAVNQDPVNPTKLRFKYRKPAIGMPLDTMIRFNDSTLVYPQHIGLNDNFYPPGLFVTHTVDTVLAPSQYLIYRIASRSGTTASGVN